MAESSPRRCCYTIPDGRPIQRSIRQGGYSTKWWCVSDSKAGIWPLNPTFFSTSFTWERCHLSRLTLDISWEVHTRRWQHSNTHKVVLSYLFPPFSILSMTHSVYHWHVPEFFYAVYDTLTATNAKTFLSCLVMVVQITERLPRKQGLIPFYTTYIITIQTRVIIRLFVESTLYRPQCIRNCCT